MTVHGRGWLFSDYCRLDNLYSALWLFGVSLFITFVISNFTHYYFNCTKMFLSTSNIARRLDSLDDLKDYRGFIISLKSEIAFLSCKKLTAIVYILLSLISYFCLNSLLKFMVTVDLKCCFIFCKSNHSMLFVCDNELLILVGFAYYSPTAASSAVNIRRFALYNSFYFKTPIRVM